MHGKAPLYLQNLLPPNTAQDRYSLRQVQNHSNFRARIKTYEMSYFPSVIKCWNCLPSNVLSSVSISIFKKRLLEWDSRKGNREIIVKSYLFPFCAGYYGRLLNQIRYGLSPLRFHLFTYNIVENPVCPGCHDCIENSNFIECFCYNQARVVMTTKLVNILQAFGFNHDISDHDNLLFLILHGVDAIGPRWPMKINELIYYCVVNFMSQTKRFVKK